jgi:hypothetical protein
MVNANVLWIAGDRRVTAVEVRTGEELWTLPADTVFYVTAERGFLLDWGLELSRCHAVVGTTMATNLLRSSPPAISATTPARCG